MLKTASQRGDTLIEVMLSVVVLSAVALGGFSIMNKGIAISYGVLERTETRTLVSQQIELVTYIRDRYAQSAASGSGLNQYPATLWVDIRDNRASNSVAASTTNPNSCAPSTPSKAFFVEKTAVPTATYKLTNYTVSNPLTSPKPGNGLWVEAVPSPGSVSVGYIDFYVKACWDAVVGGQKETMSSTVRLYDR